MGICCVKDEDYESTENERLAPSLVLVCDESELNSTKSLGLGNSVRARSKLYSHIDNETPLSSMENIKLKV